VGWAPRRRRSLSRRPRNLRTRNPRNSPYGSTSAEYAHHANPGRKTGGSGTLLGHLDDLVVCRNGKDSQVPKSRMRGLFVAWMPGSRDLALVRKKGPARGAVSPTAASLFRQFHGSNPKAGSYEWPDPVGGLREIGRLRSITYVVPETIKSPEKTGFRWVHAFGDHGESGHGLHTKTKSYPERLMPALCEDSRGALFIRRKPGNKYYVSRWIYW
jgi:hypothetical protein